MSYLTRPIEAVDPQLQPIASKVLHWQYTHGEGCKLVRVNEEPTADGMPRQSAQQLGFIEYDHKKNLYYIWIEVGQANPARLLHPRWLMALAQKDLIDHLRQLNQL